MIALILALGSSVSLGAVLVNQKTVVVPARGGNYTEGIVGQPSHINPVTASNDADRSIVKLVFSNLVDLSDKIVSINDNRDWDIRLKENIRWSDGEKLTSDDVIFTVQKIQDTDSGSPLYSSWQGVAIKRVSELELQISLGSPYAFFPQNLKKLYIIPKHLFAETPVSNWRLSKYNLQPVGSGPYVFDSYEIRDDGFIKSYNLKTNNFYFASRPLITEFDLRFYSNQDDMISAFNSSQIDGFAVESGRIEDIKRSYEAHVFFLPSYYAVFFNQGQNLALQDKKVRQGLSAAVDRDNFVSEVLNGNGEVRFGPFSSSILQDEESQNNIQGKNAAEKIFNDGGWIFTGSSTVRQKTIKGVKVALEFNLSVPQIPFLQKTAEKLQSYWADVGAKMNIISISPEEITSDTIKNRNYQAVLFGNMLNPPADLFSFWHSSQRFYPGLNLSLYNSKQADNLITDINTDIDDSGRTSKIKDLQNLIAEDYPAVFLYSPYYVYFSRKDLQGVDTGLIDESSGRFANVHDWYLKTARSFK